MNSWCRVTTTTTAMLAISLGLSLPAMAWATPATSPQTIAVQEGSVLVARGRSILPRASNYEPPNNGRPDQTDGTGTR